MPLGCRTEITVSSSLNSVDKRTQNEFSAKTGRLHPSPNLDHTKVLRKLHLLFAFETTMTISCGSKGGAPSRSKFFILCIFWQRFGKIIGWCTPLRKLVPPLWEILDPPLTMSNFDPDARINYT